MRARVYVVGARIRSLSREMTPEEADRLAAVNDPRLLPLLRAEKSVFEEAMASVIVKVALPLIRTNLARFVRGRNGLSPDDVEDIAATVQMRLVTKLRATAGSEDEAIQNFDNYVAALTSNVFNDLMRRTYPARAQLKSRIRYLFRTEPRLHTWSVGGRTVCGLKEWPEPLTAATADSVDFDKLPKEVFSGADSSAAVVRLFASIRMSLPLDDLVNVLSRAWNVSDHVPLDAAPVTTATVSPATAFETRQFLRALWREIVQLRPMHRKALLLNLRSPSTPNVVALFILTGIVGVDDLAATLDMTPEALAAIWKELPLDDLRISSLLGTTRQQVINLRRSARERLIRRMAVR
ncbi:MAG TPA: hypothetical protein VNI54_12460 [Thermoanaerobaculia bacterium]|nr:hypothetical protein [Thermoanaerobaculia bacterium]